MRPVLLYCCLISFVRVSLISQMSMFFLFLFMFPIWMYKKEPMWKCIYLICWGKNQDPVTYKRYIVWGIMCFRGDSLISLMSRRRHIGCASRFGRWPPLLTQGIDPLKTSPYLSTSTPDGVSLFKCFKVGLQQDTFYRDYLLINLCLRSTYLGRIGAQHFPLNISCYIYVR